jgi:hypothetical protein
MSQNRLIALLVACGTAAALACGGDGATTQPLGQPLFLTNGSDSATRPAPDTSGPRSNTPRSISGTVIGMGPAGDSANYAKVAGVSVSIRLPDDSAAHIRGQVVASAVTDANGHFSFGQVAPRGYILEAVPPAASAYQTISWGFAIGDWSPSAVELQVVLYRTP